MQRSIGERVRAWPKLLARLLQGAPWWVLLLLGLLCVGLGVVLILDPVVWLTRYSLALGLGLIVSGLGDLAVIPRRARPVLMPLVALGWILAGVLVVAWPVPPVALLVAIVVCALAAAGISRLAALRGADP
ncbi:secretory lipase, partial [Arthrobacter crystallopoietes BAB-32]